MQVVFKVEDRDRTGRSGTIVYDSKLKKVEINIDIDSKIKKEMQLFFTREREFTIPESNRIDDFRIDKIVPVDNLACFEMAISELYGATGIYVLW